MVFQRVRAWRSVLAASLTAALFMCASIGAGRAVAEAVEPLALDAIGMRYMPAANETAFTRDTLNDSAQALQKLGTTASGMLDGMRREGAYLVCYGADGLQLTLRVHARPEDVAASDLFTCSREEKERFLASARTLDGYETASWPDEAEGWALLTGSARATGGGPVLSRASLTTLYLGRRYALTAERIGERLSEADLAALFDCESRLLRLGARRGEDGDADEALALPQTGLPADAATVAVELDEIPLTLAPVPAVSPTTTLVVTGTTAPGARVRYSINGQNSSRFPAGADGSFTATLPRLKNGASNAIKISASLDGQGAVTAFSVYVDRQATPLALSPETGAFATETARVTGVTLPGAKAELVRRATVTRLDVDDEGRFSFDAPLRAVGVNTLVVRASADGYRKAEHTLTLTRLAATEAEMKALEKRAKNVDYAKLLAKPSAYADAVVSCEGTVAACYFMDGQPCFLLRTDTGVRWLVRCFDLLDVYPGDGMRVVGALTGETRVLPGEGELPVPSLTLTGAR